MNKIKQAFKALAAVICRFGYIVTDKAILSWDGDEDLKAGDEVYVEGDNGERNAVEDGEYRTEDGKVIVVDGGSVAEIRDESAEVASDEGEATQATQTKQSAVRQRFSAIRAAFELSYDDKTRIVYDALIASGLDYDDIYIVEQGDTYAVISVWNNDEESSHYYRYALTWNGDAVTLGERVEVKPAFVPMDFVSPFEGGAEAHDDDDATARRIEQLTAIVEKLSKAPAAPAAHQEFTSSAMRTERLSRLERILNA